MYLILDNISDLQRDAERFSMENDRMLYAPFFECVERFCSANSVLVGGRVGIDLLVDNPLSCTSFVWDLYCENTLSICRELAIQLSGVKSMHVDSRTVALSTRIKNREYLIQVNTRELVRVYSMDRYRGIKLVELMGPAERRGYFTDSMLKLVSEEIQLIDMYRNLYTPKKLPMWEHEVLFESKVYGLISGSLHEKATHIQGGSQVNPLKRKIDNAILKNALGDAILIGDYAIKELGDDIEPYRLQFITADPIEQVVKSCQQALAKTLKNTQVTSIKYQLNIPSDFQIIKYTLYASNGTDNMPFADVYNSTTYEMIPYVQYKHRVGNLWVLLRFILIDIWVLKLILNISSENNAYMRARITTLVDHADRVRRHAVSLLTNSPEKLFQIDNYAGVYMDEQVAKRKMVRAQGERFSVFYPVLRTGSSESPLVLGKFVDLRSNFVSRVCDFSSDIESKFEIFQKISSRYANRDIMKGLREFYGKSEQSTPWGAGKSLKRFEQSNSQLLKWIPKIIENHLDLGCGDGLDITAIASKYQVSTSTCADIRDNRDENYKMSNMLVIKEYVAMDLADNSQDLVTCFHVLHHARDANFRLRDIARCTSRGGILMIKDHNVRSTVDASNVDFEHLVYDIGSATHSFDELVTKYNTLEPMWYYNHEQVKKCLQSLGFDCLFFKCSEHNPTRTYRAVYKKR